VAILYNSSAVAPALLNFFMGDVKNYFYLVVDNQKQMHQIYLSTPPPAVVVLHTK